MNSYCVQVFARFPLTIFGYWTGKVSLFRSLYNWTNKQAESPYAAWILFVVAFAESSFFPIPPDVLLLPLVLANREKAWRFAFICTVGSVLGALLGYAIGAFLYESVGRWIINTYHLEASFQRFHEEFNKWGVWIILAKGLTPIPFKLVTIASGVANLSLMPFVLASIVTRGGRFYLVAWLLRRFGEPIRKFVEKYLTWVSLAILAVIIFGFWITLK